MLSPVNRLNSSNVMILLRHGHVKQIRDVIRYFGIFSDLARLTLNIVANSEVRLQTCVVKIYYRILRRPNTEQNCFRNLEYHTGHTLALEAGWGQDHKRSPTEVAKEQKSGHNEFNQCSR